MKRLIRESHVVPICGLGLVVLLLLIWLNLEKVLSGWAQGVIWHQIPGCLRVQDRRQDGLWLWNIIEPERMPLRLYVDFWHPQLRLDLHLLTAVCLGSLYAPWKVVVFKRALSAGDALMIMFVLWLLEFLESRNLKFTVQFFFLLYDFDPLLYGLLLLIELLSLLYLHHQICEWIRRFLSLEQLLVTTGHFKIIII